MSRFFTIGVHVFGILGILFIPFPFHIFPFQQDFSGFLLNSLLGYLSEKVFGLNLKNPELSSDSTYLYLLVLVLLIVSVFISFIVKTFKVSRKTPFVLIPKIFSYYLALQLLKYGFDKLFKTQFYLPEPNILFTPFGQLDKDILYWSTMGTNYSYNIFLGAAELLAALFILFRKTRILGLILALGILINVVAVNFCFDISVKVYTCFLLFLSLVLLAPQSKRMYYFFILQKNTCLKTEPVLIFKNSFVKKCLEIAVIILIFSEALLPYFKNKNFNDNLVSRPFLHGAYEVTSEGTPFHRLFIHRDGYLILQNFQDEMMDYKMEIDKLNHLFLLTDYQLHQSKHSFNWNEKEGILKLYLTFRHEKYQLEARAVQWQKLPVLQNKFHWTIESQL